jgi:hypothetical protein
LKNSLDFYLRNLFKFSRKGYKDRSEAKEGLFNDEKVQIKEQRFLKRYKLDEFKEKSSRQNYLENLYVLELLEDYFSPKRKNSIHVLDIGSKNWSYAKAEHSFFSKFIRKSDFWHQEAQEDGSVLFVQRDNGLVIDGIELDAYRIYSNFYSRYDAAKYYTEGLSGANYIVGDFLEHRGKYDYIVWILPFVFDFPHKRWGLPKKYFNPKDMLLHAFESLNEDGVMVIVNQGKDEYEKQQQLFDELQILYMPCGEFKSSFLTYNHKRYVSIISRLEK